MSRPSHDRRVTGSPNLFVVGAPKCGTTALYRYLDAHQDIFMSPVKEPHHFSTTLPPSPYVDSARYAQLFRDGAAFPVVGEASASYLQDADAARRIHAAHPDASIICLVRDPVQRAFSHYLMDRRDGRQRLSLMAALDHDEQVGPTAWGGACRMYVELGRYGEQIQRYLEVFDPRQVLVMESSTLRTDRATALSTIVDFLSLDDYESTPEQHRVLESLHNVNTVPTNAWSRFWGRRTRLRERSVELTPRAMRGVARTVMMNRRPTGHPPLPDEARAWLVERLAPHVHDTERVVGRPLPSLHASLPA